MLFSHPAMLWGLLAVAVPVVIHLFNFRRYRKVYFSNVDALSELQSESRRRSNVRRWLVLLCRVLAVAMLVLAFAGPVLPGSQSEVRSGSTVVSVYVDNTFSMDAASRDGSQQASACDRAREVAAAYSPSDRFQLLTADLAGHQMRWLSRDEFLAALDEVESSPAVPLLSQVVARQRSFMEQSGAANRHAYVISDFQRSTSDLTALATDSAKMDITLVPMTGTASDNLSIDTVKLDAPAFFAGVGVGVEVTVANYGQRDVEKVPLRLYVDGRERAVATLDIPASSSASTVMHFVAEGDGWHQCEVRIEDYPVTFDDSYYLAFCSGGRIGVLEVGGSSLQRLFGTDSSVAYTHADRLAQQQAREANLIVLNGLRQLPSGDADWLASWVEEGGSLAVLPPADAVPAELNAMLARLQAPTFDRYVGRRATAATLDYASSLFRGVFSARSDEMEMPSAEGYWQLGTQAVRQSVISLAGGADLLTLTPAGEGRVYLLASPIEKTDFPQQALFVPTFFNMALYSRPPAVPCHTIGSTDPIVLSSEPTPTSDLRPHNSELITPNSELRTQTSALSFLPDLRVAGGRTLLVLHGEIADAGIYTLGDELLAFNYGRRESQLDFYAPDEIADAVGERKGVSLLQPSSRPLDQVLRERDGGRRLWRLCLLMALLALAAETILLKTNAKGR